MKKNLLFFFAGVLTTVVVVVGVGYYFLQNNVTYGSGEENIRKIAEEGEKDAAKVKLTSITAADFQQLIQKNVGKPIIVDLWASWCKPCIREIPYLAQCRKEYQSDSLKLFLVSSDPQRTRQIEHAKEVLAGLHIDFETYVIDAPAKGFNPQMNIENANAFMATLTPNFAKEPGYPYTIYYDKKGNVAKETVGFDADSTKIENSKQEVKNNILNILK